MLAGFRASGRGGLPVDLRTWLEAEQRHVHRTVDRRLIDPGDVEPLDPSWRPDAGKTVVFPSAWLRAAEVKRFGTAPPGFERDGRLLFVWHPSAAPKVEALIGSAEPGPRFLGGVTSSSRTVLLWPAESKGPKPFFAKLSVPLVLAGEPRTLDERHARRAVDANTLLSWLPSAPRGFSFVREPFAVVPKAAHDVGLIIRRAPTGRWVPFFALTDPRREGVLSGDHLTRLLSRVVEAWCIAAIEQGLALELHAQNLLVGVDRSGRPDGRLAFRDLDGVTADACFLARRLGAQRVEALREHRSGLFDDCDEALAASFHRFFLGGPAAGLGAQEQSLELLGEALGVDATNAAEVMAEVHRRRCALLRPPPPPRHLAAFLANEQGLNARTRDPRFFAPVTLDGLPRAYDPSTHPVWAIDALELPASELELLPRGTRPSTALRVRRGGKTFWRLFVHPFRRGRLGVLEAMYPLRPTPFFGAPTSSPRALVLWSAAGESLGLKVSLDVELLGLSRVIHGSKLRRAMVVDRCLAAIPARLKERIGFEVLREPRAIRVIDRDDGQLERPLPAFVRELIPGFGLLAPGGELDRLHRKELASTLRRRVLAPLARVSAFLFFREGLLGQLHQQNVLFRDGERLVLRDLDSFSIDARVRKWRSRPQDFLDEATRAELKLDAAVHGYDDAWRRSCRADFGYLAERLLERRGFTRAEIRLAVWSAFDVEFLSAAARHLGDEVVRGELDWVLRRRKGARGARTWLASQPHLPVPLILKALPGQVWSAPEDRKTPLYSVNAMVHEALKRPPPP